MILVAESLEARIANKLREIESFAEEIPGVVIVHHIHDLSVVYMSARGQRILGVDLEELSEMGPQYYQRFFNESEARQHVSTIISVLKQNNNDESIALFQQVRSQNDEPWTWYSTSVKVFMRDDEGDPLLTIAIAIPIDPKNHITRKISRLVDENDFLRKHGEKFAKLTNREKQVLKCMALGKTSSEIAKELHISVSTSETHRKHVKRKLSITSTFDLSMYARAFDLV